jgi:hypothetical protein
MALGRTVDTTYTKRFWLSVEKATADALTVVVVCYDAAGAILSGGTHVQGGSLDTDTIHAFAVSASYGGSYVSTTVQDVTFLSVASAVKSIWIGVCAGAASVGIAGIALKCEANQSRPASAAGYDLVTVGAYDDVETFEWRSVNQPAGGVFGNGAHVWDLDATAMANPRYVATGRTTTASNGGAAALATVIAVDSITGVTSGDVIGLVINASGVSKWLWTTVNGAPSAGNITITDAIPSGWTVADDAKVVTYRWSSNLQVANNVTVGGDIILPNGSAISDTGADGQFHLRAGGTGQFTNIVFGSPGGIKSTVKINKAITGIADATPTATFTVTVPNGAHSGALKVTLAGSLGAGGAIGANEATGSVSYDIGIARTAGVNAVVTTSTAYGSAMASVAGASTITVTGAASAISGAVGATNTFTVNVTITKGSGSSANHTCEARAELYNANASGITIA